MALAAGVTPRRKEPCAKVLSSADLDRLIELPSATERQNKIESIELGALQAIQPSLSSVSSELARSLRPEIENLTRSGLVSIRIPAVTEGWRG